MKKLIYTILVELLSLGNAVANVQTNTPAIPSLPASASSFSSVNQFISPNQAPLDNKDKVAISLSKQWKNHSSLPMKGKDGSIVYLYGATLPAVVCAPLYTCIIKLQPGEKVVHIATGDSIQWEVVPSTYGQINDSTTVINIKPHDSGLQTNLNIITNKRIYIIKLKSRQHDWMPMVSFVYPGDINSAWQNYFNQQDNLKKATIIPNTSKNIANLDFSFALSGDSPIWCPTRVYSDESKTYIQFPIKIKNQELPILVDLSTTDQEQLVNYRLQNHTFIVDQLIQKAELISGVGKEQVKVIITHKGAF